MLRKEFQVELPDAFLKDPLPREVSAKTFVSWENYCVNLDDLQECLRLCCDLHGDSQHELVQRLCLFWIVHKRGDLCDLELGQISALMAQALIYGSDVRENEILLYLDQALQHYPECARDLPLVIDWLIGNGYYEQAASFLNNAMATGYQDMVLLDSLGDCYGCLGNSEDALKLYQSAHFEATEELDWDVAHYIDDKRDSLDTAVRYDHYSPIWFERYLRKLNGLDPDADLENERNLDF